tara:strand:- start:15715 stop:17544 length:1830 start_codon:yes stop_codon:yes gene_type:complete
MKSDNIILIDETISYNEIKNFVNDHTFITFDQKSHIMLNENNIEHQISDSFIDKDEFQLLQEKTYDFSNWYTSKVVNEKLKHKNVNLGSLFYIEFWMFLIPLTKKFFELVKISKKYKTQSFLASPLICELGKCLQLEFQNISRKNYNISYFYDYLQVDTNILSLKLSSENFSRLKHISEKLVNPLLKNSSKPTKNSVLLVEFHTINSESLIQELKNNDIITISYCRRRPAIWNLKSLQIVRNYDLIIPSYADLITDEVLETVSRIVHDKQVISETLFNEEKIFYKIFKINGFSLWKFIKPHLSELFKKRLEKSILEIELANKILRMIKPNSVVIQSESGTTEQIILSLSKSLKIPVILLQHGFLKNSIGGFKLNKFTKSILHDSDHFFVWGNYMINTAKKFNMNLNKISALGSFSHDNLFKIKNSNKEIKHLLLITEGPICVDVHDYSPKELDEYRNSLKHIFQTTKNLNKKLIVKLHPYEKDHDEKTIAKEIDSSIRVLKKSNLQSLIESSDVVISLGTSISTGVLDAIIMNKPVIRLSFGEWYDDFGDGSCLNTEKNDFQKILNQLITRDKFRQEVIDSQKKFLDEYLINQGSASKNIVSQILDISN